MEITPICSRRGLIFVLGMRRSGTSVLREIITDAVSRQILFEPHDIWFAATSLGIERLIQSETFCTAIGYAQRMFDGDRAAGAKWALNPGVESFGWRWLDHAFVKPRYVFICRRWEDTWASYRKQDVNSIRGVCDAAIHQYFWRVLHVQFANFSRANPDRTATVGYEALREDPALALEPVFSMLGCRCKPDWLRQAVWP